MTPVRSRAFGLVVEGDALVPGLRALAEAPAAGEDRLRLWNGLPAEPPAMTAADAHTMRRAWSDDRRLLFVVYPDGVRFAIAADGHDVWVYTAGHAMDYVATYLLGPIIGIALRLRGHACLHASAVVPDGRAVVFCGSAGAGKSTTASLFVAAGQRVIADDITSLALAPDGGVEVIPAFPRLRVWPEGGALAFGGARALDRLTPSWDKRYVDLHDDADFHRRAPLRAIVLLGERRAARLQLARVAARDALLALVANTYAGPVLEGAARAAEFEALSAVVARVPVLILDGAAAVAPPELPAAVLGALAAAGA